MPYVLGADGTRGAIDCIHLVYQALHLMEIPTPPFKRRWYDLPRQEIMRDITAWGTRIPHPTYDGDVSLLPDSKLVGPLELRGAAGSFTSIEA